MKKFVYTTMALLAALACGPGKKEIKKTEIVGPVFVYTDNRNPAQDCVVYADGQLKIHTFDQFNGERDYIVSWNRPPSNSHYNWYKPDSEKGKELKNKCDQLAKDYEAQEAAKKTSLKAKE